MVGLLLTPPLLFIMLPLVDLRPTSCNLSLGAHTSTCFCNVCHQTLSRLRPLDASKRGHYSFNWGDCGSATRSPAFLSPGSHVSRSGPSPLPNPLALLHKDLLDPAPQDHCGFLCLLGDKGHWETYYTFSSLFLFTERPKESAGTREGRGKLGEASSGAYSQVFHIHGVWVQHSFAGPSNSVAAWRWPDWLLDRLVTTKERRDV